MEGSSQHQANAHQAEPANSQRQDDFLNLECERDREEYREGNVCTTHTSKSHSRGGSHVSQRRDDNKATLEGEVTYPRGETIIKPCKRKLII